MYYDKDAHDGVSVEVHKWENNSANSGKIISDGIFHFPTTEDSANPRDAKYPVDVKNGSGFYDEHDFVGAGAMETEAEMIARGGSATIGSGYIKGFGYFEYMSIGKGWSLSIGAGGDSELSNTGNFYGKSPNFASLENFAGKGNKYGLDIDLVFGSAGYSEWHSADFSWQGSTLTYGGGLGLGLYEDQATYTTISFPRTDNYHIDYENWVENFIPLDESSRVGSW
ncbi:hypothetical protein [Flavobacterium sp. CS20]|uniref:hypothetical protein n=1 Tax=Flavobacterium sp. CS20 TaxID=2775246 RepID=UPI001B3A60F7|nr:hypothetical protein [Flavobacterium sp. CS20]QTY27323.1 hypothetical protein IGB25_01705 [Flavobacterium sp. CS20]